MRDPSRERAYTVVRLGQALLWVVLSYALAVVAQLVVNGTAGRVLGVSDFAPFTAVLAAVALLSQLGLFGAQSLALRDASVMRNKPDPDLMVQHLMQIKTATRVLLPLTGAFAGLAAALVFSSGPTAFAVLAGGVTVLVIAGGYQKLHAAYLRGFGEARLSSLLEGRSGGALILASQALALVVIWLSIDEVSLYIAIGAIAVASVPSSVLAARRVMPRFRLVPRTHWRPLAQTRLLASRTKRFAAVQAGVFLDTNIEIFIALAVGSAVDASSFAAAQRLALLIVMPVALIQLVVSPIVVRLRNSPQELEPVVRSLASIGSLAACAIAVPLVAAGGTLSKFIFGSGFDESQNILILLSIGYIVRVILGLPALCLVMAESEGHVAIIYWSGIGIRVIAGGGLGYFFGIYFMTGVGVVVTIATILAFTAMARRRIGIRTWPTLRPQLRALMSQAG